MWLVNSTGDVHISPWKPKYTVIPNSSHVVFCLLFLFSFHKPTLGIEHTWCMNFTVKAQVHCCLADCMWSFVLYSLYSFPQAHVLLVNSSVDACIAQMQSLVVSGWICVEQACMGLLLSCSRTKTQGLSPNNLCIFKSPVLPTHIHSDTFWSRYCGKSQVCTTTNFYILFGSWATWQKE